MGATDLLNRHFHADKQSSELPRKVRLAVCALASCLALSFPVQASADASPSDGEQGNQQKNGFMYFDIEAQPLQDALELFNAKTGFAGLYNTASLAGRLSTRVRGWFTPDAALRMLIDRTGLSVYYTASDAFVLEPEPVVPALSRGERGFEAILQKNVRSAFCRNASVRPGDYRAAFSLRINSRGRVENARLLETTGDAERDKAILATLSGLELEKGPADPTRSFVMLVLPQDECSSHFANEP